MLSELTCDCDECAAAPRQRNVMEDLCRCPRQVNAIARTPQLWRLQEIIHLTCIAGPGQMQGSRKPAMPERSNLQRALAATQMHTGQQGGFICCYLTQIDAHGWMSMATRQVKGMRQPQLHMAGTLDDMPLPFRKMRSLLDKGGISSGSASCLA